MTTVASQPTPNAQRPSSNFETKVTRYDQVSSLLVALVIMVGFFAGLLFIIWLTRVITFKPGLPKVVAIQDLAGRGAAAEGVARDIEEPGVEELPDVPQPQLADALEAMTDAISTTRGVTNAFQGMASEMGTGSGQGDSRGAGPGGEGDLDVIPPWERWQIKFATSSAEDYGKQLDFFKVELGAINRNTPNVDYARDVSTAPKKRKGTRDQEPRIYFVHTASGALVGLTRQLLEKAGIATENRYLAQFYSNEARAQLEAVENAALGRRSLSTVRKTVFGVRPAGSGFEFFVVRQDFIPGT